MHILYRRKKHHMIDIETLSTLCKQFELDLTKEQAEKLDLYAQMLVEWNEKINLTAITDPKEMVIKHFLDSLLLIKSIELPQGASLIDVGTGAGFPSVPVKVVREDLELTLLDSLNKRLIFLQELCANLKLKAQFTHARAEDGGKDKKYREKYDFACARAVASLRSLSEYCLPFVKVGGAFLALKGPDWKEELEEAKNAIGTMGGKLEHVQQFTLPDESKRAILVIRKISQTPAQFPRTAAKMSKNPIV